MPSTSQTPETLNLAFVCSNQTDERYSASLSLLVFQGGFQLPVTFSGNKRVELGVWTRGRAFKRSPVSRLTEGETQGGE